MRGVPSELFLGHPQPMEWLDFTHRLPYTSTRTCRYRARAAGHLDGLHMHLVVELDELTSTVKAAVLAAPYLATTGFTDCI